jgi:hypothetical protein
MNNLSLSEIADALWPDIGQGVLSAIISLADDNEADNLTAWLDDHYQAKITTNTTPPKLSEFIRTFCRGGVQGSVKVNLGATRPGVGGVNLLSNSVFSFEADGLDSLLAMLTVLSSFFEPALFVAAGDMRAKQEIARYRGEG